MFTRNPVALVSAFLIASFLATLPLLVKGAPADAQPAADAKPHAEKHIDLPTEAVAVLMPLKDSKVEGVVVMKQFGDSVKLEGKITGLTPGKHGFHIHEFGDLRDPEGKSAGEHFNPTGAQHAGPDAEHRHLGDLGNIEADDQGVAAFEMVVKGLKLHFVIGRSLVVHAKPDDLKSQPSGDSGDRIAVGVIGFGEVKEKSE